VAQRCRNFLSVHAVAKTRYNQQGIKQSLNAVDIQHLNAGATLKQPRFSYAHRGTVLNSMQHRSAQRPRKNSPAQSKMPY